MIENNQRRVERSHHRTRIWRKVFWRGKAFKFRFPSFFLPRESWQQFKHRKEENPLVWSLFTEIERSCWVGTDLLFQHNIYESCFDISVNTFQIQQWESQLVFSSMETFYLLIGSISKIMLDIIYFGYKLFKKFQFITCYVVCNMILVFYPCKRKTHHAP